MQLNNIDQAFETWCKIAQNYLRIIPKTKANGQKIFDAGNSRGRVLFQKQCRYPKQVRAHSLNIHSRKIAYALSRVQELQCNVHHGTQSLNTWKNLHKVLPSLNNPDKIFLQQILHEPIAPHTLKECFAILSKCLKESQAEDKKQRLQAWKQKMSNSEKQAYKWLKKETTKDVGTMKLPGGSFTADVNQQLAAFLHIWKPIFQKFSDQSPDLETFRDHFVPFMKKQSMQVAPMTGDLVLKHLWKLKPSSAGLDSWKPESLIALGQWYPHLFKDLPKIFEWIEVNAKWPFVFYQAYTSLIPKPNMSASPGLEDFRPITVLGSIYRLWAKIRFSDALAWQEHWAPNEMWGCRQFRGAETMCLNIALQLEQVADTKDAVGGGIAYDFRKCFDLIPIDLLFEAMCARGMSDAIIGPLKALYANLKRVFNLKGTCGDFWKATNGLVQGCPLSMIGLNSLVAVVLEIAQIKCPEVVARAYADDLSAVCVSQSKHCLIQSIHKFHRIVKALEEIKFGEISNKKSHTFGHPCLQKAVEPHYAHYTNFRIVGGSFLAENVTATHAELEAERFQTWSRTIERMRHAPWPWRVKARRLMATQSQATFAQGTHSFSIPDDELTKIRSRIMRTMFSVDFYSMNTHLTFAILLPPQLDPSFAHVYQTLRTIARCLRQPHFRDIIQNRLRSVRRKSIEGPVRKIRKLLAGPFRDLVEELLHNDLQGDALEEWAHRTRDKWREVLVQKASKNRPQHYSDICDLDHFRTMALYRKWDAEAQILEDENLYMKLGVLRRLLVGGLLTEERDSRHRKDLRQPKCQCGAEPTVLHISWYCPLFENTRKHILDVVKPADLPMCARYSALIPIRLQLSDAAICTMQSGLVDIWQQYFRNYKDGENAAAQSSVQQSATSDSSYDQNGHNIRPGPNGKPGAFCCKCGKYVTRHKHIKLKITGTPCPQRNSTLILSEEGFNRNTNRLDSLYQELEEKYNNTAKHTLEWNRQIGKTVGSADEGIIKCVACSRQWK